MKRRKFLHYSAGLTALSVLPTNLLFANANLLNKIGIQLFSLPKLLEKDFSDGIRMLAQMGYSEIEMYGPFPFSTQSAIDRWATITPSLGFSGSGFFGHTAAEVKRVLNENKITVPSIHTDLETLSTKMNQLGDAAQTIGYKYVVLPGLPPENRKTLDDYKRTIDLFNRIGEQATKAGLRFAYHNHGYGLHLLEGKIPVQMIIENTDPKHVYLEMDLFWTVAGGVDPIAFLEKYPGRYKMMHVKNMKQKVTFSGDGGDAKQWIELFPQMSTAGEGALDLKAILTAAKKSGVEHFFVEQDMVQAPEVALKKSIDYLKGL
jgi:sugar phosphate isomerase/epimerase